MKSWKTTTAGVGALLTVLGTALNQIFDGNPATNPDWNLLLPIIITSLIGIFARDNNVTSEQVKAGNKTEATTTTTPPPSANHFGVWLLCGLLGLGVVGCRTLEPGGVYHGDKVLFEAETTIVTSYDLVNTFLKWEQENRVALQTWPEIKKYADKLRTDYPHWHRTAVVIRDAYAVAPNETQAANLQKSLVLLRAALTEASGYMARAAGN